MGMIISTVEEGIGLKAGDEVLSINGVVPSDIIEYSFLIQEEEITFHIRRDGEEEIIELEKDYEDDLGISFESAVFDKVKPCTNKCIFCFVDGQPEGLRKSLYVKDDDWRLSYLQGTYVTLTNFTEKDWEKIGQIHASPLYISVHATNPDVRIKMLKNPRAGEIMENLKRLENLGIEFHAQIVLCPGFNDGKELERTLNDLKKFKNLLSLAVVPVGISKHHTNKLKQVDKAVAVHTINALSGFKNAMASDELFLTAQIPIPERKYYGKFHQIEDGVGAIRLFLDDFQKQKKKLKPKLTTPATLTLATGSIAFKLFSQIISEINVEGLTFDLVEVKNDFFGERISVAGLVCGADIIRALREHEAKNLIIPSVMLKEGSEEFLDGTTLDDIRKKFGSKIYIAQDCHSFKEFVEIINSL